MLTLNPKQVIAAMNYLYAAKVPLLLWGPPGGAKSSLGQQFAAAKHAIYHDIRLSQKESVDLRGLPVTADGRTSWLPPADLPYGPGPHVLHLEEINQAAQSVQAASYQLILDRRLGDYELPEDAWVMASANRKSDRALTNAIGTALANRFCHLHINTDLDVWAQWGLARTDSTVRLPPVKRAEIESRIAPEIIAFHRLTGGKSLHKLPEKPDPEQPTFPSPRSWEYVSRIFLTNPPAELEHPLYGGCVGEGEAMEFIAFLRVARELGPIEDYIKHPTTAPVHSDAAQCLAVCSGLAKSADAKTLKPIIQYLARLEPEFAVRCMQDIFEMKGEHVSEWPGFVDFVQQHKHVMFA